MTVKVRFIERYPMEEIEVDMKPSELQEFTGSPFPIRMLDLTTPTGDILNYNPNELVEVVAESGCY